MMKFASEKAMALVDGQLAPAEAPAVIQEIARTPALMRLVQKYLAVNPWKIRQIYQALEEVPVPDRLRDTVLHSPMGEVRRSSPELRGKTGRAGRAHKRKIHGAQLVAGSRPGPGWCPRGGRGVHLHAHLFGRSLCRRRCDGSAAGIDCIEHATGGHAATWRFETSPTNFAA